MMPHPPTAAGTLTGRMVRTLAAPLSVLALLLAVFGGWAIYGAVQAVNDRILLAAARAISESLVSDDGAIAMDLPPSAFAMLEDAQRDNVFYVIRHGRQNISGYDRLAEASPVSSEGEPAFRNARFLGYPVRVVTVGRHLPSINGLLTVTVAETTGARDRVVLQMLVALALLELCLLGLASMLLPRAVQRGLRPLDRLTAELMTRSSSSYAPLPVASVPAELSALVAGFNSLLARLEAAAEGIRRFTADASHQMRTPLAILKAHVAGLRATLPPAQETTSVLDDIDQATARLQNLLVQLLALARAEGAASTAIARQRVDAVEVTRDCALGYADRAHELGVDIGFHAAERGLFCHADPHLLGELVGNLVDNAIRYNRPGGAVDVSVMRGDDGAILVLVEDDGPGLPAADRARVFDRFVRLNPGGNAQGSGLGLAISRTLAEALGARLELHARDAGSGLAVCITLPAATAI